MTPVLCLMNMVDIMELEDDDEYEGIVIVCQRFTVTLLLLCITITPSLLSLYVTVASAVHFHRITG